MSTPPNAEKVRRYRRLRKAVYRHQTKVKFKWWSLRNWLKGYRFGPIQRFRCCGHTTPYHYQGCAPNGSLSGGEDAR